VIRGDSSQKNISLIFTGHEFAEGGEFILKTLKQERINASFFFTGDFYRNKKFKKIIQSLRINGNYLGSHSDKHLLYCDWKKRDSLLVTKKQFQFDLADSYTAISRHGIKINQVTLFLPPYEWYNDTIAKWTSELKLQLINYTPGTLSHADYTTDSEKAYRSNKVIYNSIINYEQSHTSGLNGFLLLMHIGAGLIEPKNFIINCPN
jgi:peptidoglycan/xylan/chitin deacetylase (PgdA/CDA1 family)